LYKPTVRNDVFVRLLGVLFLLGAVASARAQEAQTSYPTMAPIEQYRAASSSDEKAMALSAAPASISRDAEVLVLDSQGYEAVQKGKNGFVCLVERSWANDPKAAEFWNAKIRAPMCLNAAAARSVLPEYLERTKWILAGVSKDKVLERLKLAIAKKIIAAPEQGSMCYMMSKQGYLSDAAGHWHPHLMFFLPPTDSATWGANLPDSPLIAIQGDPEPVTVFLTAVMNWSDGTPAHVD
jgi:hypothetical protein